MSSSEEFKKVLSVPLSIITASFILVIMTSGITNSNGVSALIGGYMGLFVGILIVLVITAMNVPIGNWFSLAPFLLVLIIIAILISYLFTFFNRIADGEVSNYYTAYSTLTTIFLVIQLIMIFSALFKVSDDFTKSIFPGKTFPLIILFGVIDMLMVVTLGVILKFYSTQG
jgi:hypothetical protein